MGKQAHLVDAETVIDHAHFWNAAVVRFVMLQSEVSDVVAESEKEMVVAIMVSAEEPLCLLNELLVFVEDDLRGLESARAIGSHVQFGTRIVGERNYAEVFAGEYRSIDQLGERDRLETNFVARIGS